MIWPRPDDQRNPRNSTERAETRRIGYLIPRFPEHTHTFFWREIEYLRAKGLHVDIVSTRRPSADELVHAWAPEASRTTTYLLPMRFKDCLLVLEEFVRTGWSAWRRALSRWREASCRGWRERLRLFALMILGIRVSTISRQRGWKHLHVSWCDNPANIAVFYSAFSFGTYSLALHCSLRVQGGNQVQKWKHALFGIVVSEAVRDELAQVLVRGLPDCLGVAGMGVDIQSFTRRSAYEPWCGGELRLFSCGRLAPVKGHDLIITAVRMLRDRGYDVSLRIAGSFTTESPKWEGKYRSLVESLDLETSVSFLGRISEDAVKEELEHCHVFVSGSRFEALPVAILEAMAMEVPIVATRVGGVEEAVGGDAGAVLVDPESPESIAEGVSTVVSDEGASREARGFARRRVTVKFDRARNSELLLSRLKRTGAVRE